jgi:DNA-binding CsgD family transcriptional regulator
VAGSLAGVRYARGDIAGAASHAEHALNAEGSEAARQLRGNLMWLRLVLGAWDEGLALAGELIEEGDRAGDLWNLVTPLGAAARIHAWRGRDALAVDLATRAVKISRRLGNPADQIDALESLCIALGEAGHPTDAAAVAAQVPLLYDAGVEYRPDYPWSFAACAEAFLEAGDPVSATEMIERARAEDGRVGWSASVDRVDALIRHHIGETQDGLDMLEPWLREPTGFPFEQARVDEVAARLLHALGERDPAVARAGRALDAYRALAVGPRIARMEEWLAKRRRRVTGRPKSQLPAGMTPRELEVMNLILHGLTTGQIAEVLYISRGTARKHIENLMRKAEAPRRSGLVAFAREHNIRPRF